MAFLAGQDLTAAALNAFASGPVANLRQSSAQSIPNVTFTAIAFDSEDVDTDGGHSNTVNNSRYTIPVDGYYRLSGCVGFVFNATGFRAVRFARNATAIPGSQTSAQAITVSSAELPLAARSIVVFLSAGEYVQLHAYQDSGGALNTTTSSDAQSTMSVTFERA